MVRDSKVFLMDEPLSNLDAKLRNQMRAEIILLRQKLDTTFIYVTHDQTEAMTLGDRIVIMKDGYIMQVGTPSECFDMPANLFVAEFIGAPKMNIIKTNLIRENGRYYVTPFGARIEVAGEKGQELAKRGVESREILLGVRPEYITLAKDGEGIATRLEVNEMMGSELHLHVFTEDETRLIVRVPTISLTNVQRGNMASGASLNVTFEGKVMHFFDPETEKNLLCD
jgi:multiple sugar transport system ATP-binding protein